MSRLVKGLISAAVLLHVGMVALAQERAFTPCLLSIVTPLQVPSRDYDVGGLRINLIYGECRNLDGLDIGVAGRAIGHGNGLQLAGVVNLVEGDGMGMQVAPVSLVHGSYAGLQIGAANYAVRAKALQIGLFNGAGHLEGCQIGLINITRTMFGVQIGLANVIQDNDVPFLPILNCYF